MGYKYRDKHIAFLRKNIPGRSYAEVTKLFNKRFRLSVTIGSISYLLHEHGLCNYDSHRYTPEEIRFLKKNVKGRSSEELTKLFNKHFKLKLTVGRIRAATHNRRLRNGRDTRIKPGNIPPNKGKKGVYYDGCQVSWFKKGQKPINTMPIGSERVTVDGYTEVKFSDKSGNPSKRWKGKHTIIWEKKHGPVPKGYVVIFLDGNKQNFKLSNLQMISRAELAVMNHNGLFSNNKDMTKAGYALAAVKVAISRGKQKTFTGVKKRKMIFMNRNGKRVYVSHGKVGGKERYYAVRENKYGVYRLRVKKLKTRATFDEAQRDLYEYALKMGWQRI